MSISSTLRSFDDEVKVRLFTAPFKDPDEPLIQELKGYLQEKVESMMSILQLSPVQLSQNLQAAELKDTFTKIMTDEFRVPIELSTVALSPRYPSCEVELFMGIKITDHAVMTWHDMERNELGTLLNDVFGKPSVGCDQGS